MDYIIRTTTDNIDFNEVYDILSYYGLSHVDAEMQKKIFNNSYAVVFLIRNNEIIGVGRAISDGICQALLCNIALDKDHRGMGLGKVIVDKLLEQVKGCNVILYTLPKYIGLYEHWGFSRMKTGYAMYQDEEQYRDMGFI